MGARSSNSTYQYTLKSDNVVDLKRWALRLAERHEAAAALVDVDTDQQDNGVESYVEVDRDTAARLGVSARDIDNALYNNFGQRQVSTIYGELNQYKVILGVAPRFARSPIALKDVYVPAKNTATRDERAPPRPAAEHHRPPRLVDHHRQGHHQPGPARPGQRPAAGQRHQVMVPLSALARFAERPTAAPSATRTRNWRPPSRTTSPTA
jgi:multidrug efflux pump